MDKAKSFEFKKGVRLYYRYDKNGNMEILYMDKWIGLKEFASIKEDEPMNYTKQKEEIKKGKTI